MKQEARDVILLGRSLLDYLPQARQPSSTLGTTPGLAASREVPCEACGARGRVHGPRSEPCAGCEPRLGYNRPAVNRPSHGCRPCLACDGWGWRRARRRELEESPWDAYAGSPLSSAQQDDERKRWEELQDLERRLAHTTRLLALWEGLDTVDESWEERRQLMWRSGDYGALSHALAEQGKATPNRVSVFWHVVCLGEPVKLTAPMAVELMRTAQMLADRMPKPIRVPAYLREEEEARKRKRSLWRGRTPRHADQREQRNALIRRQAEELGWSTKKIARYHGLEPRRVRQILAVATTA